MEKKIDSGASPICEFCYACPCTEDNIFELYHHHKTSFVDVENEWMGQQSRPISTCKKCHRDHNDYYSPVDYHTPVEIHCMTTTYPDMCIQCNTKIIIDHATIDEVRNRCDQEQDDQEQDQNTKEKKKSEGYLKSMKSVVPCDSLAWEWTAAVDRDSSFHWDFGYTEEIKNKLWNHLDHHLSCTDLNSIIEGYLCLNIKFIQEKILSRGNIYHFQLSTNNLKQFVISIDEYTDDKDECANPFRRRRNRNKKQNRSSSWRYIFENDFENDTDINKYIIDQLDKIMDLST